ncbi:putative META domain containing protein [Leishmania infantum JPCM5]|uniref:META_domain_containing_protein n=2 Tax=Leishmania infantum TaxID=5671 RepID=A0A6L0X2S0_LEIIN|nr:putative META domain containing protein [Leishmania infantum JPCM5]CAC9478338.1 META_domain_containing_protein [Leishmania infantum]CAM59784.1 putative META domain containing protein [Leishmania infantum JPCM5]SUZ40860.1 META_domain_containing_protein [Leishmania infantum]|eukprot:XP_001464756.1 putative META domain containing protein [Leishmania infantum JPCM5]
MTTADDVCGAYTLSHCDGRVAPTKAILTIHRCGETLTAHATVANDLRGTVQYENCHIVGSLHSTGNEASPAEESVEQALSKGFADGFNVVVEINQVLLKNANSSFVFARLSKLSDLNGEHAIIAINDQPPNQEMTMTFTPDGNGGSFVTANIANSLRGNCQIDAGLLRGDLATTQSEADESLMQVEKLISEGFQQGFHVCTNESGILLQSSEANIQLCRIVSHNDLEGEYVLKSFNGAAVPTRNQPGIVFKPVNTNEVEISIVVTNRIRGTAALNQNVLSSEEPLMSTRMMGTEEESQLENAFNVGFQYGLETISHGNELTLKNQDCKFVLVKAAAPAAQHGGPTYKGTYCNKCFKTEGNGLLFRIVNEHEKKWAFYNDTEDLRIRVRATFGARSKIEALGNANMYKDDDGRYVVEVTVDPQATEMFIQGDVNGFRVLYDAQPI